MADCTLLHNPRCRKSREALTLLQERGIEPTVRLYLDDPLKAGEIAQLLDRLGIEPEGLARKGESEFKEQAKGKNLNRKQWIALFVKYPRLIERPVLICGNRAVIGRPPESVLALI
jgi:arsenate reductase